MNLEPYNIACWVIGIIFWYGLWKVLIDVLEYTKRDPGHKSFLMCGAGFVCYTLIFRGLFWGAPTIGASMLEML